MTKIVRLVGNRSAPSQMQTMSALRYGTALVSLTLLAVLGGCRKHSSIIAVIPRTTATLLWEPIHLGAVETARKAGLHIYWNAPADDDDVEKQLSEFTSCVERGYSGVFFA